MRHDLRFLYDFCIELGLQAKCCESSILVDLGGGAILSFLNDKRDEDCLVGFLDGSWHFHSATLTFNDPRGHYTELDYLALLEGLASGAVLVCTRLTAGAVDDRWLIHSEFNDEFRLLEPKDQLMVQRAFCANSFSDNISG